MPGNMLWTDSQVKAWDYIKEGVNSGLSQTGALGEYREGGGHIRDSLWGDLWHRYDESGAQWDKLYTMRPGDSIPESLYTIVGVNYREQYATTVGVRIKDGMGESIIKYITIESDHRQTLGEISGEVAAIMNHYDTDSVSEIGEIDSMEFFERWEGLE